MSRNILFKDETFANPKTMISEHTELDGCNMKSKLGALIDGKLNNVIVTSSDDSPIKISALAVLTGCVINCTDLLIEGSFTGKINAKGSVELGESALVEGEASIEGTFVCSPLADSVDLKLIHPSPKKLAHDGESRTAASNVLRKQKAASSE